MNIEELMKQIAYNEFIQDQLSTELAELEHLLRATGFPQGVISVKQVAMEMLENDQLGIPGAE